MLDFTIIEAGSNYTPAYAVESVNGKTGVVDLVIEDIPDLRDTLDNKVNESTLDDYKDFVSDEFSLVNDAIGRVEENKTSQSDFDAFVTDVNNNFDTYSEMINTKASQSHLLSVSHRVSELEEAVSDFDAQLADKADQTDLEALQATVADKANTSVVNAIGGRVNTLENQILTKADNSTVESLTTTVNSKASKSELLALTSVVNTKISLVEAASMRVSLGSIGNYIRVPLTELISNFKMLFLLITPEFDDWCGSALISTGNVGHMVGDDYFGTLGCIRTGGNNYLAIDRWDASSLQIFNNLTSNETVNIKIYGIK